MNYWPMIYRYAFATSIALLIHDCGLSNSVCIDGFLSAMFLSRVIEQTKTSK
jgi:hypothetical protein